VPDWRFSERHFAWASGQQALREVRWLSILYSNILFI
jgi:hypothetical protein